MGRLGGFDVRGVDPARCSRGHRNGPFPAIGASVSATCVVEAVGRRTWKLGWARTSWPAALRRVANSSGAMGGADGRRGASGRSRYSWDGGGRVLGDNAAGEERGRGRGDLETAHGGVSQQILYQDGRESRATVLHEAKHGERQWESFASGPPCCASPRLAHHVVHIGTMRHALE